MKGPKNAQEAEILLALQASAGPATLSQLVDATGLDRLSVLQACNDLEVRGEVDIAFVLPESDL